MFTVPSKLLNIGSLMQTNIEMVEMLLMDVIHSWEGPSTEEGLICVHEVLQWQLDGYAAELRSVLEGYQFAKNRLDEHVEHMRLKNVPIPGETDDDEEADEGDGEDAIDDDKEI